ncbi:MAG TPA: glutamyl-tRNA reductase [Longimicrobiales bacterium]|nr:glutamyl-tRNA reductase [Longimicrobiales bacterium]
MALTLIGLSHHTAPLEVRERFAAEVQAGRHSLADVKQTAGVREGVMLSTCNRTELYLVLDQEVDHQVLVGLLPQPPGVDPGELPSFTYVRRENTVVEHLFRVVSSLDSMMLGEPQIQGQVRSAYESALKLQREHRVVGPILSRLFETALRVGGRVRAETRLGDGAASIPSAAVELARKIFGGLRERHALVLGTGEMSELAVECLINEGARTSVVSREPGRARELASRGNGAAVTIDEFAALVPTVDIIVTATAAPHAVITRELINRVLPRGPREPLLIVDLALPRDVEPEVGSVENVFLYNLDDLHHVIEGTLEKRRAEVPFAEAIIRDGVHDFWSWYRALEVVPLIRELRERAEQMRSQEVERTLRSLNLNEQDRAAVEALTRQLLAKLLHQPTVRLREAAATGQNAEIVEAARYLFELKQPNGEEID